MGFGIRRWDAFGSTPVIESCKPNYRLGSVRAVRLRISERLLLCRFLGRLHHKTIPRSHDRRPRSAKARNRGPEGARFRRCDLWGFEACERLFSRGRNYGHTGL